MSDRVKSHGWAEMQPLTMMGLTMRAFVKGPCRVLVGQEDHCGKQRWHLSISCANRYPHWEEIKDARYSLLPMGLYFAQILPPLDRYTNVHPNCFHLWELDEHEW